MASVLGIAEHNGWAEFVVVGASGNAPVVRSRERVQLRERSLPSQPYHHEALAMPLAEAQDLVDRVTRAVAANARAALADVQSRHGAGTLVMQESPFVRLPGTLAEVLESWHLTCAADGMMYREGLADAAAALGLDVVRYPRRSDPIALAADALEVSRERVDALLRELGRPLGKPWRKEHRLAAAAALWVLARQAPVRV